MSRYDLVFSIRARRAVSQSQTDLDAWVEMAQASGMSEEAMAEALDNDLMTGGKVFGKFIRSMTGAAHGAVMAAARQGEVLGTIDGDAELRKYLGMDSKTIEEIVAGADPEEADQVAQELDIDETWICTLVNTCYECLPLHGQTLKSSEWEARGLSPELMHEGWDSECKCRLVPETVAGGRADLQDPLKRAKLETPSGLKGSKQTRRAITQGDIDLARYSMQKALETEEGRRALRILGSVNDN